MILFCFVLEFDKTDDKTTTWNGGTPVIVIGISSPRLIKRKHDVKSISPRKELPGRNIGRKRLHCQKWLMSGNSPAQLKNEGFSRFKSETSGFLAVIWMLATDLDQSTVRKFRLRHWRVLQCGSIPLKLAVFQNLIILYTLIVHQSFNYFVRYVYDMEISIFLKEHYHNKKKSHLKKSSLNDLISIKSNYLKKTLKIIA